MRRSRAAPGKKLPTPPTSAPVSESTRDWRQRDLGSRERILIADDNADEARTLAAVLMHEGLEVYLAFDGAEALEVGMPKLNGYQVARAIRERDWSREVYLIALTGWGQEQARRQSREAGFDRHLVKPADPDELLELIGRRAH